MSEPLHPREARNSEVAYYKRKSNNLQTELGGALAQLNMLIEENGELKFHYQKCQAIIGTLLAINNKYHGKRTRYSTYDGDYLGGTSARGASGRSREGDTGDT